MVENFFIAAKSFPRKEFGWGKFWSKFLLLQNHFLGNSLDKKNFGRKFFWSKNFWSKFLLLQNHFLGISLDDKIYGRNFFLLLQNHFLGKSLDEEIFGRNFYCCKIISTETDLMKNSFVRKWFWSKILYWCKIISS